MKASRAVAVLLALLILVSCSHTADIVSSEDESGITVSEVPSEAASEIEESPEVPGVSAESEEESSSVTETSAAESAADPAEESSETSEEQSADVGGPQTAENVTVRINEIMASSSLYLSPEGKASDWIELYNYGASQVDLSGLYLTDNVKKPKKDPALCGVIEPGGVMLIFAGDDAVRENGVNVMGFTLAKGETVALCDPNGNVICSVEIPETLKKDRSYAYGGIVSASLVTDNRPEGYVDTSFCTPGYENGAEGYEKYIAEKDKSLGALVIYELMTVNDEFYKQSGNYYDWVELKNVSSKTIDLSDYYLSDDPDEAFEWRFPSRKLEPGKTVIVFCSGNTKLTSSKYLHASFKLSSEGERLAVTHKDGAVSDSAYISDITYKGSYGRMDGRSGFFYFASPTPEQPNKGGMRFVANAPVFSAAPGIYAKDSSFAVAIAGEGVIRYTLDGSEPNEKSAVYSGPLEVSASTVIRAVAYAEGRLPSGIATAEYLLCGGHDLPVVSIAADPDDMFSEERGICYGEYGDRNANFRQNWERKVHFTLYDTNGETVSADCGIKLTGEGSRKLPKKSFQLKFRSLYGTDELVYDIFGDGSYTEFKCIKLRVGEDYPLAVFRDELTTSLAAETGLLVQKYRYCVLYLNGEYYGIYCFRNKIDEYFIADTEGCDPDDVTIVIYDGSVEVGSKKAYKEMYSFVTGNDMSKTANYEKACELIDVESLADWVIVQVFTGNRDLANDRAYLVEDGKWKWILYDTDWGYHDHNAAYYLFTKFNRNTARIASALLKNKDFKDLFLTRLGQRLDTVYSYESVCARCDELASIIASEIPANSARWNIASKTWNKSIDEIKAFVAVRRDEIVKQTKSRFGLSESDVKKYFG